MPAQSKSQQRFFGVVKAMQKGDIPKKGRAGKIAKTMDKDDVDDFASTKHKGKPEKVKREQRVRNLIKKMVREEMNEVRIPFSSSHIKQLKRAFKDMKGTLPDNNPLVQQIVTLLKKTDKKVLKQIASADIKYLSDKAKDILGEGKLNEKVQKYVVGLDNGEVISGDKAVSEKKAHQIMTRISDRSDGWVNPFMIGVEAWNGTHPKSKGKPHKMNKKKIMVKEGTCGYGENGELGEEPAGPHLIKKKKIKEGKDTIFDVAKKVMKDKQHQNYKSKKGMVKLDMQTANLLTQVFKKVNPKMKKILSKMGEENPARLVQTLWAVAK